MQNETLHAGRRELPLYLPKDLARRDSHEAWFLSEIPLYRVNECPFADRVTIRFFRFSGRSKNLELSPPA